MSADVIPLALHRPVKAPTEVVKVAATTAGTVVMTVMDGEGDEVEVHFTLAQAKAHLGLWDAAIEVAEDLTRG